MLRRDFLKTASALGALILMPRAAFAAAGTVDVIIGSDQNVVDFWNTAVVPAIKAAHADVNVKVTPGGGDQGMMSLGDRALAALKSKTDPQVDLMEAFDPRNTKGGIEAGLWTDMVKAGLSNWDKVQKAAIDTSFGVPYRGSQVVLAYDSNKVKTPPKTWAELVAWIKANPGQFIYNRPDKGGSGGNFVRRAIHEANGRDPSKFTAANFDKARAEDMLKGAWDILKDLAPSLYDKGAYTAGNTPSLQLLASGAVAMVPTWSDMGLKGLKSGELPPHIKLAQLQDLAFCGGFAYCVVPTNAVNQKQALQIANVLLSPAVQEQVIGALGGFPAIEWKYLSDKVRAANADVIPAQVPSFPDGEWASAVNDGWYRAVAPGIQR